MSDYIKITDANLIPLKSKHYSTDVIVGVDVDGITYNLIVAVSGYAPNASCREKSRGWEPDWGMDHTESESHLFIAQKIINALTGESQ